MLHSCRFKAKYHPDECSKKKEAAAKALRARCDAFTKLLNDGTVASVSCDTDKNEALVRLLDAGRLKTPPFISDIKVFYYY